MGELDWLREQIHQVWGSFRAVMLARPPVPREQEDALLDFWVPAFLASGSEFTNDETGNSRMLLAAAIWMNRSSFWPSPHEFLAAYREAEHREPPLVPHSAEPRARVISAPRPPEPSADERARAREEEAARRAAASRLGRAKLQAVLAEIERRRHEDEVRRARGSAVAGTIAGILAGAARLDRERSATAARPGETPGATKPRPAEDR